MFNPLWNNGFTLVRKTKDFSLFLVWGLSISRQFLNT